jgi:hypothetical protein
VADRINLEDEYFHKLDEENKAKLRAAIDAQVRAAALAERKALHAGRCGRCGGRLQPQAFRGVEIDVCEDCGSVLLDPGELEALADHDRSGLIHSVFDALSGKK